MKKHKIVMTVFEMLLDDINSCLKQDESELKSNIIGLLEDNRDYVEVIKLAFTENNDVMFEKLKDMDTRPREIIAGVLKGEIR